MGMSKLAEASQLAGCPHLLKSQVQVTLRRSAPHSACQPEPVLKDPSHVAQCMPPHLLADMGCYAQMRWYCMQFMMVQLADELQELYDAMSHVLAKLPRPDR